MTKKGDQRLIRNIKLRKRLWPEVTDEMIWNSSRESVGFVPIPRTMQYFFQIMDKMSNGKPVSSTYFTLWCHVWDSSGLVKINNPSEFANETGFSGQRALSTWRTRMKILIKLGFIKTKPLMAEEFGYVIILNPYHIVKKLHDNGEKIDQGIFNSLVERSDIIQASDFDDINKEVV